MITRKTYQIVSWADWDHELNRATKDFNDQFHGWPNILQASSQTHRRIDIAANAKSENIQMTGIKPEAAGHWKSLSGFQGIDYFLEFCIDDSLALDTIRLLLDPDPDGKEPIPEEDTVPVDFPIQKTG